MCLENRVAFILPDYDPQSVIDLQGSGSGKAENVYAGCSKLTLEEPYNGNTYAVTLKQKNHLYHVITKMELAELSDNTLTFDYYYSIRKGNQLTMVVKMNTKALNMVSMQSCINLHT